MRHDVYDHEGNCHSTFAGMCRKYRIKPALVLARLDRGWCLADALTKPARENPKPCQDFNGKWYLSHKDMCEAYGISYRMYHKRIMRGWNQKDALTKNRVLIPNPNGRKPIPCSDLEGNLFESVKDMKKAHNIGTTTFYHRVSNKGMDYAHAASTKINGGPCTDHKGNVFKNKKEMCKAYHIAPSTFYTRLRSGLSLEEALTQEKYHYQFMQGR